MRQIDKTIKISTKKGEKLYARAKSYVGSTLDDIYKNCSYEKVKAYNDCLELYSSFKTARDFRICSYNIHRFSCSFEYGNKGNMILCTESHTYNLIND